MYVYLCVQWFLQLLLVCVVPSCRGCCVELLCGTVVWNGWSYCLHQVQQEDTPTTSQSLPLAPLWDDIEPSTTTKHEVELEHNVEF